MSRITSSLVSAAIFIAFGAQSAVAADVDADSDTTDADPEPAMVKQGEFDVVVRCASSGASDGLLSDYVVYSGPNGADPRTVSVGEVADGLCGIIDTEGPMNDGA
jgi:hypothetical protein